MDGERPGSGLRIEEREDGFVLEVQLAPRASRNAVLGVHEGRLKVALTAPPVEGAANEALVAFIAAGLGVPKRSVRLIRGQRSRHKTLRIDASSAVLARILVSEG